MTTISATAVNELRKRTEQSFKDCKAALTEASGDMEKAVEILRIKNKSVGDKRIANETNEGRVAAFIDPAKKVGAIVEVLCESAPTAKNDLFVALANDVAKQVAVGGAPATKDELMVATLADGSGRTVRDRFDDVVGRIKEKMTLGRFKRLEGVLGSYCHHDGTSGALLQVEGDKVEPQALRDVCMHIVAMRPVATRVEDLPAETVAKEKEIARAKAEEEAQAKGGKPPEVVEKMAEGKLRAWYAEAVLVEQPFAKDPKKKVGDVLKAAGAKPITFVRYKVGEL